MKRVVFHLGGYDPGAPDSAHRRFVRELRRFEATWSVRASASAPLLDSDKARWHVASSRPNWQANTDYRLLRWDDVMAAAAGRFMGSRLLRGVIAFGDFVAAGAL